MGTECCANRCCSTARRLGAVLYVERAENMALWYSKAMTEPRTYKPTRKRLSQAARKGNIPYSAMLTRSGVLIFAGIGLYMSARGIHDAFISAFLRAVRAADGTLPLSAKASLMHTLGDSIHAFWPMALIMFMAAVCFGLVQTKGALAWRTFSSDTSQSRLSQSLRSVISVRSGMHIAFLGVFIGAACLIVVITLRAEAGGFARLAVMEPSSAWRAMLDLFRVFSLRILALLVSVAGMDFAFQRLRFLNEQRMTRSELLAEQRSEGVSPERQRYRQAAWNEAHRERKPATQRDTSPL